MTPHVGVAHRAQVMAARDGGFVAFSHGREAAVRRLSPGDAVVYYAPRSDFDGEPVQAFVAHATITGEAPRERDFNGRIGWVRDAAFAEVVEAPVRPLLPQLSFVRDPRHWGMAFRQGEFAIPMEDYERIARALFGGAP